ncbi:Na+/H+ antiporter subunit E [Coralloluteibacterium thermophilus]|uniref:Na+/H+ antiporter subunit E n=1 Tax=Coralloluteibacterium thermophilum TaxID=2707049 RepID=A0ABV9NLL3_9GAMM
MQVTLVSWALWFVLAGTSAPLVGLAFAVAGALAGSWLAPGDDYRWRPLRLAGFALYFLRESVLGGIDVARRALAPSCPVEPTLLDYRIGLPAGAPRTLMVAMVSLLPGTLSVDIGDDGLLRVHALSADAGRTLAPLERRVAHLFGLEARPGAPVPAAAAGRRA